VARGGEVREQMILRLQINCGFPQSHPTARVSRELRRARRGCRANAPAFRFASRCSMIA